MKPHEEETRRQLVAQWLHKAHTDVEAAAELLASERHLLYPACFHSQQAAEKYLKGFLTWHQVEFPKTHSIRALLNLVKGVDASLAHQMMDAATLTVYGVEVRYPGDLPEPDADETKAALALAQNVRHVVTRALPLT